MTLSPLACRLTLCLLVVAALTGCGEKGLLGVKTEIQEMAETLPDVDPGHTDTIGALQVEYTHGAVPGLTEALRTRIGDGGLARDGGRLCILRAEIKQRKTGPPDRGSKHGAMDISYINADGDLDSSFKVVAKSDSTELVNHETWEMIHSELMRGFADAIVDEL